MKNLCKIYSLQKNPQGPYSPTIRKNTLCLFLQDCLTLSQMANFTLFQIEKNLQTTISKLIKIT